MAIRHVRPAQPRCRHESQVGVESFAVLPYIDTYIRADQSIRSERESMAVHHHQCVRTLVLLALCTLPSPSLASSLTPLTGVVRSPDDQPLEMTLPDGVELTLEPGSLASWMPDGRFATETHVFVHGWHLLLRDGEIDVKMPSGEKGRHAFLVSTLAGTLTDWRGKAHVAVHGTRTAAAIYEGALVVGSNGHGFAVYDGAGVVMHKGFDPDKSRHIPGVPTWDTADSGTKLSMASGLSTRAALAWLPVPGTASYRVAVARDATMRDLVRRETTKGCQYVFEDVPPGATYYARVRAVGPEGIAGEWSAVRRLRTIRYQLPEGAFIGSDGVFVIPEGSALSLLETTGIEMASETAGDPIPLREAPTPLAWTPAASSLEPPRDATIRVVHLRDTEAGLDTQIALARRTLRADIALTPRRARAGDPIDIRAIVSDPSGRIDTSGVAVHLVTMLGIDPIPATWERSGTTFTSRIFSVSSDEPSVVRVVATDSQGTEIGRGVLELAAGPSIRRLR